MIAELAWTIVLCILVAALSLIKGCSWSWPWTSCSWSWSSSWQLPFSTCSPYDSALGRLFYCSNSHTQRVISKLAGCCEPSSPDDQEQECFQVNEEDLKILVSHIDETDGGPPWKLMMQQSTAGLTYEAWYRNTPSGHMQYRTRTVFDNVSPELLRDFFWDDEFRPRWDKMLIHFKVLSVCLQTGTMIVHWIRKLPLFYSDREYIIIRRIWESASEYYCVTKGTPYPSLPRLRRPRRVDVYHSSWRVKPVKPRNEDQQIASEVLLFHCEDIGLPKEVVKMAVKAGMWNLVKKLYLGVQVYAMEKANDGSPSYYAIMAHITTPASPSKITLHDSQVEDESQSLNPEAQARHSS